MPEKRAEGRKFDSREDIQQKGTATSPQMKVMQRIANLKKLSNTGFGIRIKQDHLCAELVYVSSSFSRYHGNPKAVF